VAGGKETSIFEGLVAGQGVVLCRAELEVAGSVERGGIGAAILLDMGDTRIEVTVDAATLVVPLEEMRGRWASLSRQPAASLFRERAPAPDASARLRWAEVRGGDRVVVRGSIVVEARAGGSYREPAEAAPRADRARPAPPSRATLRALRRPARWRRLAHLPFLPAAYLPETGG
jgi:hypothetical protein